MSDSGFVEKLAVYLVADPHQTTRPLFDDVSSALDGGVTCIQLRAKGWTDLLLFGVAHTIRKRCSEASALFIVNDRVDIALAVGADGVHLGVDDFPIEAARALGGPGFLIGYSPETDEEAGEAAARGANYLGVGPVYGTQSKSDAGSAIGLETLKRRVDSAGIPVIGIGGITNLNATAVIETGAVGVAVVGAILGSNDPRFASMELAETVHMARSRS